MQAQDHDSVGHTTVHDGQLGHMTTWWHVVKHPKLLRSYPPTTAEHCSQVLRFCAVVHLYGPAPAGSKERFYLPDISSTIGSAGFYCAGRWQRNSHGSLDLLQSFPWYWFPLTAFSFLGHLEMDRNNCDGLNSTIQHLMQFSC